MTPAGWFSDLHISVTSLFRDPEVFATLRSKVLPDLISHRSGKDALRIWVRLRRRRLAGYAHIKAKGGSTIAQDASASVDGMPHSAQAAGCIDRVLPAEQIGATLQALADSARVRSPSLPAGR